MVDKAIRDLEEEKTGNQINNDDYLETDNPNENTSKIKVVEFAKKMAILSGNILTIKTLVVDLNEDFEALTDLNLTESDLVDGLVLRFRGDGWGENFQNKVNPQIAIDGIPKKNIYNNFWFWFYQDHTRALDKNSFTNGWNYLEYSVLEDAWLWKSEIQSGSIFYHKFTSTRAGYLRLGGQALTKTDYPNCDYYFASDTNLVNMRDSVFAGSGGETPHRILSEGQVQKFVGDFGYVDRGAQSNSIAGTGIFYIKNEISIADYGGGTGKASLVGLDSSKQILSGDQTLTKRYGLYFYLKL